MYGPEAQLLYANASGREMLLQPMLEALVDKCLAVKDPEPFSLIWHGVTFRAQWYPVIWEKHQSTAICVTRHGHVSAANNALTHAVVHSMPVFSMLFINRQLRVMSSTLEHWSQAHQLQLLQQSWSDVFPKRWHQDKDAATSGLITHLADMALPTPMRLHRRDLHHGEEHIVFAVLVEEHATKDHLSPHRLMEIASHDLREPLRTSTSYLQLLQDGLKKKGDDKLEEYTRVISDEIHKADQFLIDMKSVMALEQRTIAPTKINVLTALQEALQELKPKIDAADAMINISAMPELQADSSELKKVLTALIDNAIKFRQKDKRPYIEVNWAKEGSQHVFCVRDNGMGIAPKFHEEVFLPFKRLNRIDKYPGSGVGLTLARKIISLHHGRLWLESREGFGTSVFFSLPA